MNIDDELCRALAERGASGDGVACKELVEKLWPAWVSWVRGQRSLGSLAESDDHVNEVVVRLVEKLGQPDGHGLRLYPPWQRQNPEKTFSDWIRIVTKNVVRDYAREQLGPKQGDGEAPSLKRLLNDFASSPALEELGIRPPLTAAQTARELMEFAETRLPREQLSVLRLWLEGASFEEIAGELALTADAARKLVRSAVATLRREFGGQTS